MTRRFLPIGLTAVVTLTLASPALGADCVERISRMPIGGVSSAPAAPMRAAMLRTGPAAKAPAAKRPRAMAARTGAPAVRKARPIRKASAHRPARKRPPVMRRADATPGPVVVPSRAPTPYPVAAADLATPVSYALIRTTVCEGGPSAPSAQPGVPAVTAVPDGETPVGPGVYEPGFPGTDTDTGVVYPPEVFPPGPGPTGPTGGTGTPLGPPPTEPPIGPPVVEPPTTPVPEPGTWALLILGFGVLGARLRARRATSAS